MNLNLIKGRYERPSVGETQDLVCGKTSGFLGENKEILDAELWAILEALGIARKETPNAGYTSIIIFCDFWGALSTKRLENPNLTDIHSYRMGTKPFRTPRKRESRFHSKNPSWKGWKSTWALEFSCIYQEKLDWWKYVTKKLPSAAREDSGKEASRRGFYVPWTKKGLTPILGNAPKKVRFTVLPAQGRTRSSRDIFG